MTQDKNCPGCGVKLTFITTPNLGGGKLNDGGRVCRKCFSKMASLDVGFGLNSKKLYSSADVKDSMENFETKKQEAEQQKQLHKVQQAPQPTGQEGQTNIPSQSKPTTAKCPKCGSTSIHVDKKGFSASKGCCGWLLVGPIGLLCGQASASKLRKSCLNCNHTWT